MKYNFFNINNTKRVAYVLLLIAFTLDLLGGRSGLPRALSILFCAGGLFFLGKGQILRGYVTPRILSLKQPLVSVLIISFTMSSLVYIFNIEFPIHFLALYPIFLAGVMCRDNSKAMVRELYYFIKISSFIFLIVILSGLILSGSGIELKVALINPSTVINFMLVYSFYLIIYSLMGKPWATAVVGGLAGISFIANIIKLIFLSQPFYPWDFYMLEDAFIVSPQYITPPIIIGIIVILGILVWFIYKKGNSIRKFFKLSPRLHILPFALAFFLGMIVFLENSDIAVSAGIEEDWTVGKEALISNGFFVQNFYYFTDMKEYISKKPEEYSLETMDKIKTMLLEMKEEVAESKETVPPNVVVIMSETFWDAMKLQGVNYSEDLTYNFRKNLAGDLVVPVFGGGTANSEFEALTGFSTFDMAEGVIAYNVYINKPTPSIAEVFKNNGYKTTAIHPNTERFYNRDNAYKYMGFDRFIDIKGFEGAEIKGKQVADMALTNKIISELKASLEPQFIFAVTIQNHDSYYDKYEDETKVKVQSKLLDEVNKKILESYSQGIYDADRALGRLIEEIEKYNIPTIVYYFGDHLPRLGYPRDIYEIYYKTGFLEKGATAENSRSLKLFNTQLAKWSNYKELKPFKEPVSAFYLAYDILEEARMDMPLYFSIYPKLMEEFPVLSPKGVGVFSENNKILNAYKLIQYDILFGNRYILKE